MGLFDFLKPDEFVNDLKKLEIEKYLSMGRDVFVFDFDNTLGLWRNAEIEKGFKDLLERLKAKGARILIVSNGRPRKLKGLNDFNVIWRAGKPFSTKLRKIFQDLEPSRVVFVGDQIFTDVITGKRFGFYTIKVNPLSDREFFGTKLLRIFEKVLLRCWKGR
ncbi:MAG: HAD superfamily (Subfamily IIIA) phosphatase, TIGR01668 [Thermotoga sp. 50_1627]|uniref:YqeG family HAD IIIA-type phosphatase n=1 Tax=Pseudothermotoga sp. TaxID=2033661 RepID=UPI00076D73A1|nr:MAG: HAD superfamily (Subfamily IIIA) phosphatase, TIGR01668 [Thermotoga sp. 50_64]KUK25596.1 MAG: HAD superfamily (Subfamily IIIA) phosphatase, TIGR01668 [Thermotoga sp. 50_1627]MBC7116622.1 YqeG family HAD IIIA-type phosphatase [Pseudothermotoga sp.]MDK2922632.1 putative phosphatase [Pseudothermotoga sp.]HBT40296.1 YqeG family HAD IIIA-type phosphatase [Pseudothermotoga sp.]